MSESRERARVAAVVVAAGRGVRAGGGLPKQYRALAGRPVLAHALGALLAHPAVGRAIAAIHPDDRALYDAAASGVDGLLPPVSGGATRQQSVHAGLEALAAEPPDLVLIHDAARPFVSASLVDRAIAALDTAPAAVPALAVSDTVIAVDAAARRTDALPRDRLRTVQTPQAFRYADILAAHRTLAAAGRHDLTDDGAVAAAAGLTVATFPGDPANVKLTTPDDFAAAEARLADRLIDVRTGTGFDVHAFGPGDRVMLGGVAVPHGFGLVGHSDADVVLHALTDALFGALGEGDIGSHFPPSDPQWKGADSEVFLAYAVERVGARGGVIGHLDVTVIGEAPKVGPHREAIRARIAGIARVSPDRVGVKATTTEQLGFAGRREGLAALASATIRLPLALEPR
ncbi:MAG TPA: bifunctional 2-C-methyl-D-erythritol 4-phosphate cytidylyltransferase/2-C-methyl-D-erythritol 2,4-cyclodiphosphate synthase [Hyphomicrobiales bacterium]|nr:bifunctional 2-C-methyl-D-erythritol 4-phosphate cytidylyltransferase/2-C-methyl-D-erythritol 2,4-cyclodiphosphate synthase [Hyphomicrobiales bacterium]